jgi:urease accessory protein
MKSGTHNFHIERTTPQSQFSPGQMRRWAVFGVAGESCTITSEGAMLIATLREGDEDAVCLFRIPFRPALDRRHLVTIGWRRGKLKVLLDAKLLVQVDLPLAEPRCAAENAFALRSMLPPLVLASLFACFPSLAHLHTGVRHAGGLADGFIHPFGGLDHLCAMLAVGLWAAQRGGRSTWFIPFTFVCVMAAGAALGMAGVTLPFVEAGIVGSLIVFGVLIAAAVRLPLVISVILVATSAIFHGHSHGTEMPFGASGLAYGFGFFAATALLHLAGIGLARYVSRFEPPFHLVRLAGSAVAVCGVYCSLR